MYLSYFSLNMRYAHVRKCLNNTYEMHRTICSGFRDVPTSSMRKDMGILYRLQFGEIIKLYVISKEMPEWDNINKKGFILMKSNNNPKSISALCDNFKEGNHYSFDLLANPCKKIKQESKNSKRIFLSTTEERLSWLERKSEQSGFNIIWVREDGNNRIFVKKEGCNGISHIGVRFRGDLCVTDSALFRSAFENGIGSGKAFGMGMMLLFPVGS